MQTGIEHKYISQASASIGKIDLIFQDLMNH